MFADRRRELGIIGAALIVSALAGGLFLWQRRNTEDLDMRVYDAMVRQLPDRPPSGQVAIVEIDEASLEAVGRWPWTRDRIGVLVSRILQGHPSVTVLDMMFPEPDNPANSVFGAPDRRNGGPETTATSQATDRQLALSFNGGRVVVGYYFGFRGLPASTSRCPVLPKPLAPSIVSSFGQAQDLPDATSVVCSVPLIGEAVTAAGFLNGEADADGTLRRLPLLVTYRHDIYPSLAVAAILARSSDTSAGLVMHSDRSLYLQLGNLTVPVERDGAMLLRLRGKGRTLRYYSAIDILTGRTSVSGLKNRIVVVGGTAGGLQQTVATAFDRAMPGVEAHATAIDNLLAGDYFMRPGWATAAEMLAVLLAAFVSTNLLLRIPSAAGVAATLGLLIVFWASSFLLLAGWAIYLSPLFAMLTASGCLGYFSLRSFLLQGSRRRRSENEIAIANRFITDALGELTAARDTETGRHVVRIQQYVRSLCEAMTANKSFAPYLTRHMIDLIVQLAPIHDIGKVGVPDYILHKPGPLTESEFQLMKEHVTLGKRILNEARAKSGLRSEEFYRTACEIVYSHHERWDGKGYPEGLAGNAIPIPGRLLALADVYDALVSRRAYKPGMSHAEAMETILLARGRQFDPAVVDGFMRVNRTWQKIAEEFQDETGLGASH